MHPELRREEVITPRTSWRLDLNSNENVRCAVLEPGTLPLSREMGSKEYMAGDGRQSVCGLLDGRCYHSMEQCCHR